MFWHCGLRASHQHDTCDEQRPNQISKTSFSHDYAGNPVRVIDVFVDELDLGGLGFDRIEPPATGRPGYHPSVLLKLYIYGYLNRVQSSRRLEREAGRNVEVGG